jgi:hypothetical protein
MALPRRAERPEIAAAPPGPRTATATPGWAAFQTLRAAFVALPVLAGVDKFLDVLGPWRAYLAPDVCDLLGVSPRSVMDAAGMLEIFIGLVVALRPSVGGWLVATWLWAIVVNLLAVPGYYDIALRDLALSLGAVALARLAPHFESARPR